MVLHHTYIDWWFLWPVKKHHHDSRQHMKWKEYRTIDDFRMVCDNPHPFCCWWTTWSRQSVVNANGRWILMCFPTLVSNHPNFFQRDFGPSVSCVNSGHRYPKHEILIAISWPFQWSYLIMCIMSMIRLFQNLYRCFSWRWCVFFSVLTQSKTKGWLKKTVVGSRIHWCWLFVQIKRFHHEWVWACIYARSKYRQRPTVVQWTSWTCLSAQNFSTFHEIWFAWKLCGWRWSCKKILHGWRLRRSQPTGTTFATLVTLLWGRWVGVTWEEGKNDRYIGNRQVDKSSG